VLTDLREIDDPFEAVKRPDYIGVIPILENGNIVVLEQRQPQRADAFYSFPGGRVDEGETPEAAARRELREEAGLGAHELVLLSHVMPFEKYIFEAFEFVARGCSVVGQPTESHEEKVIPHEFTFDDLIEFVDTHDVFRGAVSQRVEFLRAKYDPGAKEKLKKLLYG
jgi:8-oxo-dGTP pyrophosphatase MutT (NUDIX family)